MGGGRRPTDRLRGRNSCLLRTLLIPKLHREIPRETPILAERLDWRIPHAGSAKTQARGIPNGRDVGPPE